MVTSIGFNASIFCFNNTEFFFFFGEIFTKIYALNYFKISIFHALIQAAVKFIELNFEAERLIYFWNQFVVSKATRFAT